MKQIISGGMWQERIVHQTGEKAQFKSFREFVEAYPPEGLHTTVQMLVHICNDFGDMEAVSLISAQDAGKVGGNNNPNGIGGKSRKTQDIVNVDNVNIDNQSRPTGNSTTYTMRALAKRAPELHAQVVAGAMSPNAAAVKAGFRVKPLQVPDDPTRAAQWFLSHKDEGWIATFVAELIK